MNLIQQVEHMRSLDLTRKEREELEFYLSAALEYQEEQKQDGVLADGEEPINLVDDMAYRLINNGSRSCITLAAKIKPSLVKEDETFLMTPKQMKAAGWVRL